MSLKNDLVEKILDIELRMFLSVSSHQKVSCQEDPESFKRTRRAQFLSWSEDTQKSYLNDLQAAEKDCLNLMTQKYARMDNLIPMLNENPLIEKIIKIQFEWQKKMFLKYPCFMGRGRSLSSAEDTAFQTSFETYLRGELETYSDETLRALYKDVTDQLEKGESMTEKLYLYMVKEYGYKSLDEAEEVARGRTG
ncbi:MAG: DUF4125 family protein [Thermodesulfobacteriota bacterium]|nr:DUF4125 family protein [Thermodesulfobacteriota bacterium]